MQQPIIQTTDEYIIVKIPRKSIPRPRFNGKTKRKFTARDFRGILKDTELAQMDSVKLQHKITQFWAEQALAKMKRLRK